ncbi:MAG: hypothetical protein OXR73_10720 [Myxococcales bacterium]|nr:hypothetical protein [Myxococcales bacterium]
METDWTWDGDLATLTHRQVGGSGWTMTDTVRECGTLEPTITRDDRGLIESIRAPCSTLLHEYARGGDGPIEHVEVPDIWTHSGRPEYPSPHEPALPVQWAYRDAAIQHTASARAALASLVRTIHELAYSEDFWRAPSPEEDDAGI